MSGGGPSTSNTNSTTPSSSTRSRLLLLSQATPTGVPIAASPSTPKTGLQSQVSLVDEKIFARYSSTLLAETNRRKIEIADHNKRLADLRKEAEMLDYTDWMYEPVEKLLGK